MAARKSKKVSRRKTHKKNIEDSIINATQGFSPSSYSPWNTQPWPKNKQQLYAMLDDAKSIGYSKACKDMDEKFKKEINEDREMIKQKRDLLSVFGQSIQAMTDMIRSANHDL